MKNRLLKTGLYLTSLLFVFCFALSAAQYSVTVETKHGFKYSGDYSGTVNANSLTTYTIGPYSQPFTVTLTVLNNRILLESGQSGTWCWYHLDDFKGWVIDGTTGSGTAITIATDASAPAVSVSESWSILYADNFDCGSNCTIRFEKTAYTCTEGSLFSTAIYVKSTILIAAIDLSINYDPAFLAVDTSQYANGVKSESTMDIVANSTTAGRVSMAGFAEAGLSTSADVKLCTIYWKGAAAGAGNFSLVVGTLADPNYKAIKYATVSAQYTVTGGLFGDVNGSGVVDIVDALMIAQHSVGLAPAGFNSLLADVNRDGAINIVDALVVARYYTGLVPELPI